MFMKTSAPAASSEQFEITPDLGLIGHTVALQY
jgi:hypothetical protein